MRAEAELIQIIKERIDDPTAKQVEDLLDDHAELEELRRRTIFSLNEKRQAMYDEWYKHSCLRHHEAGAIGSSVTFTITPTSLGLVIGARCVCGSEIDLTCSEDW